MRELLRSLALSYIACAMQSPGDRDRLTWLARVAAAIALATFCSADSGDLPSADIAAATVELVGLLLLGFYARWSSLWLYSVALVAVTTIHGRYLWHDDPRIGGMDDIGPAGIVLWLPAAWVVLALGATVSRLRQPQEAPPTAAATPAPSPSPAGRARRLPRRSP